MKDLGLIELVDERHRSYVEMFCEITRQELVSIIDDRKEGTHYKFSDWRREGAYDIRGIFATLEGVE